MSFSLPVVCCSYAGVSSFYFLFFPSVFSLFSLLWCRVLASTLAGSSHCLVVFEASLTMSFRPYLSLFCNLFTLLYILPTGLYAMECTPRANSARYFVPRTQFACHAHHVNLIVAKCSQAHLIAQIQQLKLKEHARNFNSIVHNLQLRTHKLKPRKNLLTDLQIQRVELNKISTVVGIEGFKSIQRSLIPKFDSNMHIAQCCQFALCDNENRK